MKRVALGLKMSFMLLLAIVAYAALLKRGKFGTKFGAKIFCLVFAVGLLSFSICNVQSVVFAKAPIKSKAPAGPPKQIYTRSDRTMHSQLLGVEGKAAYIVSALGTNSGILITDVTAGGLAAKYGVSEGDVVLTINQRVVTTARDADRILGEIPSGTIKVAFAHPSDNGLQLYNANFAYTNVGCVSSGSSSVASKGDSGGGASLAELMKQIPGAESHMVGAVNKDRASMKEPAIDANGALTALARAHAQDMAARNFFGHVNPDGLSPEDRARRAGLKGVYENVSMAQGVSDLIAAGEDAERQMMAEPPNQQNHRSNILNPNHRTVGVGIAVSKKGTFYMAQEFQD
jgi:uncharacterized protein YkwD